MSVGAEGEAPLPLAVAAARHGLIGAQPLGLPDPDAWAAAVPTLEAQRLVGAARVLAADRGVALGADAVGALATAHQRLAGRDLLLERDLLDALDEWGIDPRRARVLKGVAVAHLDEADPSLRSFGDVDLLLPGDVIDAVVARAVATGSRRSYPEPRRGFDRRFGKGVNLVRPSGRSIDLHRTLAQGPFGVAVDVDDLLSGSQVLTIAGTELRALDPARRWVHACYHAALGSATPPLVSLRDVVLTMPRARAGIDAALATAHRWRGDVVVREALRLAVDTLVLDPRAHPLFVWAASAPGGGRTARWLDVYRHDRSTPLLTFFALEALPARDRPAYAAAILAPRRVGEGDDRALRWQRALRAARRLPSR